MKISLEGNKINQMHNHHIYSIATKKEVKAQNLIQVIKVFILFLWLQCTLKNQPK